MQPQTPGFCPICERQVTFQMKTPDVYRSLHCSDCQSGPRQRALWFALNRFRPGWRDLRVHESSPGWDIVSRRLVSECKNYTASQYDPNLPLGEIVDTRLPCKNYIVQNLERQTFDDKSFDLVVTQDVFEHIMDPFKAIAEIARTLRDGGATIMSVPVVRRFNLSRRRARRSEDGSIEHILPPEYHGNPIDGQGALVTIDWGYDIAALLSRASGLWFVMQTFENMDYGIRDECNQILIGTKGPLPILE
ncbi:class I SAM-dependent methyltransferase [Rhodopseudomonas sp. HC1]|uniref:class I SAM-dependent methyltransferase n=1 Tax=Rhodopseudomonas infernalis TaxID=2897386 RepID=UPI001EE81188|nr:class I SAM-dependent methyltransferase [Rhodopseudomonas infernalis]MCG6204121.1 class I SAM-dependent methyltransferase [Rhodopseudomonas infernalis]